MHRGRSVRRKAGTPTCSCGGRVRGVVERGVHVRTGVMEREIVDRVRTRVKPHFALRTAHTALACC